MGAAEEIYEKIGSGYGYNGTKQECIEIINGTLKKEWFLVSDQLPEDGVEVIGYSEKWIHPDFNPDGTRVCFISNGEEWHSAKWDNDQDSWHTHAEWCCAESGGTDFNPTHWTYKPKMI